MRYADCHPERKHYVRGLCKQCHNALPEQLTKKRQRYNRWMAGVYEECILAYGGKCSCCGEQERKFLQLDHIEGGGNEHRLTIGGNKGNVQATYRWLRREEFPPIMQVLCANCHQAKARGGCPHAST